MLSRPIICLLVLPFVQSQIGNGRYQLPALDSASTVQKPTVQQNMAHFFELSGQPKQLLDVLGLRRGIIPPKSFEIGGSGSPADPTQDIVKSLVEQALSGGAPGNKAAADLWAQAFRPSPSVRNNNFADLSALNPEDRNPALGIPSLSLKPNGGGSSTSGIPNVFPSLPKPPVPQPRVAAALPSVPNFASNPEVPTGGLGPLGPAQQGPAGNGGSFGTGAEPQIGPFIPGSGLVQNQQQPQGGFGSLFPGQNFGSGGGGVGGIPQIPNLGGGGGASNTLASSLMGLLGLGGGNGGGNIPQLDLSSLNSLFGFAPEQGNRDGASGLLTSVIYNSLTDGVARNKKKAKEGVNNAADDNGTLTHTLDEEETESLFGQSLTSNVALIQQLITQPSSPFCNPKPQPVAQFDVDAFMGTWYQVLYSPPMSSGPCSMIGYKKNTDISNGGPGTVFDTFEYSSEGSPFGEPRISSGYAMVKGTGELIYRTTSSPTDVNVVVAETGPLNSKGEYEYVVMVVNCNFPVHVFARDPLRYKQKYEARVNTILEQKGMANGFLRLLNVIAPVDASLCFFPPTLFNIHG